MSESGKDTHLDEARARAGATKKKNTHRELMSSAARAFYTAGYLDTNVRDISAGKTSEATFYNTFGTKAAIGNAVLDGTYEDIVQSSDHQGRGDTSLCRMKAFEHTLSLYPDIILSLAEHSVRTGEAMSGVLPLVFASIKEQLLAEQMEGHVRNDVEADDLTETCLAIVVALAMRKSASDQKVLPELSSILGAVISK
jgi:AcrR family transcriptional regulator